MIDGTHETPYTNTMKYLIAIAALSTLVIVGCVSRNPNYPATSPDPYVVSPVLTNATAVVSGVSAATAPINPYAPITNYAGEAILVVISLISAAIAKRKNDEAKRQTAAADSLAETVVGASQAVSALKTAGANGAVETVAKHIDNNTPG